MACYFSIASPDREQRLIVSAAIAEELHGRYSIGRRATARKRFRRWTDAMLWHVEVTGAAVLKRLVDVVVSAFLLLALSPLLLLAALLTKLYDGGPVFFWQMRVGQNGKLFDLPKFRSMVVNAEALKQQLVSQNQHKGGLTFKMRRDPRITKIGALLRKSSIDELPQLWCVLKGELSLVGPRPALPGEVRAYTLLNRRRLEVKPGLTCIWQVSGRGDIPFERQVELDLQYIDNHSLWLDLCLLARTIPAVLTGRGSY